MKNSLIFNLVLGVLLISYTLETTRGTFIILDLRIRLLEKEIPESNCFQTNVRIC